MPDGTDAGTARAASIRNRAHRGPWTEVIGAPSPSPTASPSSAGWPQIVAFVPVPAADQPVAVVALASVPTAASLANRVAALADVVDTLAGPRSDSSASGNHSRAGPDRTRLGAERGSP